MVLHVEQAGLEHLAADVVEVDVDAVRAGCAQRADRFPALWSTAASNPSSRVSSAHLASPPAMPTVRQPLILAIWPDDRAHRAGGGGDHHRLAGLRLAALEQAEVGGQAGDAIDAEQVADRLGLAELGQMPGRQRRIVLPAGVGEHQVAGLEPVGRGSRPPRPARRRPSRRLRSAPPDRCALHPGAVGGVEGNVAGAHQHLALPGRSASGRRSGGSAPARACRSGSRASRNWRLVGMAGALLGHGLARAAELLREVLQFRQAVAHRQHRLRVVDVDPRRESPGSGWSQRRRRPGRAADDWSSDARRIWCSTCAG